MIEEDSHNEPPHETKSVSLNQLATVLGANSENSGIFIFMREIILYLIYINCFSILNCLMVPNKN